MNETVDPITHSALQHWSYCLCQCALFHLEQVFCKNVFTKRGHVALASQVLALAGQRCY